MAKFVFFQIPTESMGIYRKAGVMIKIDGRSTIKTVLKNAEVKKIADGLLEEYGYIAIVLRNQDGLANDDGYASRKFLGTLSEVKKKQPKPKL
ncbi:hypothetical protein [Neisseria weixii]|nr:hypothetical protein [Neisseria weixii]